MGDCIVRLVTGGCDADTPGVRDASHSPLCLLRWCNAIRRLSGMPVVVYSSCMTIQNDKSIDLPRALVKTRALGCEAVCIIL